MRFFYLIMCLFLLIPGQALSGQNIIDDLLENYKNIQSVRTKFNQILKSKTTREEEIRSGNIICKKSLNRVKVRWEIEKPEHEILIVNGNIIWDYFPEEKLAYKYKLSKIEQSRIIFDLITGKIDLKKKFNITNEGIKGDLYKIKLVPFNPEPNMVLVYLWIDKNQLIKKINIIDFFGNENFLEFDDINLNPEIDSKLFWNKPPSGVKILEGRPGT